MHGITITYENEVLAVTLPSLLPKRRQRQSAEFLLDPLYFALEQYAKEIGRLEASLLWAQHQGMDFPPYVLAALREAVDLYRERGAFKPNL